jgi:Xaa-Pro dipeptidase
MTSERSWDVERLKRQRRENLQAEMARRGIGAALLKDGLNVRYLLDIYIPGGQVYVPREGDAVALVRPRDVRYVQLRHATVQETYYHRAESWRPEYGKKIAAFVDGIKGLMAASVASGLPLAIDELDVAAVLALARAGVDVVDSLPVVETARSVKTKDEIEIYRTLGRQYAQVFNLFRDNIKPGVTEKQLEAMVVAAWPEVGGDDILQINVCSGKNMNPWRRLATNRPLQAGELVGMDFHGRSDCCMLGDASRTYLVGDQPTAQQTDLYRQAWEYVQGVADVVRAGRTHADVVELIPPVPSQYQKQQRQLPRGALGRDRAAGLSEGGPPARARRRHVQGEPDPIDRVLLRRSGKRRRCEAGGDDPRTRRPAGVHYRRRTLRDEHRSKRVEAQRRRQTGGRPRVARPGLG